MAITLSVATSADGSIDDRSCERLILSTQEDWAEVYRLRAEADAIVIGAQTLRSDNPRLRLKSEELRELRVAQGRTPEPCRVVISRDGTIDPSLRIFEDEEGGNGGGEVIIFSTIPRPSLEGLATVIVAEQISAAFVVTELEKRDIVDLFVEGGAQILAMFLLEGCVTRLRVAVNPAITVADPAAPRFELPAAVAALEPERRDLGGMAVSLYTLGQDVTALDEHYMARAIDLGRRCTPCGSCYCVGAVIVTPSGEIFEGYTHESSATHHAEQEAIAKAEATGVSLRGATIYSSMEPCSTRSSEPESCSTLILRHGFARVLFALYEPSCFVQCQGALNLRRAGVEVHYLRAQKKDVRLANAHLFTVEGL